MTNGTVFTALDGLPLIDTAREFDAPVEAVFAAHADADLVVQWLGPHGYTMTVERWDFASGGGYRYVHHDGDDSYGFRGLFHTVRKDELIVQTFEYDGAPDRVSLETLVFAGAGAGGGRSRLTSRTVFGSVAARDGMVASGMATGVTEGYERLDALLPH